MSGQGGELKTADGQSLNWESAREAYSSVECDAYLAKVLAQKELCRSTSVTAARFQRALTGNSTIAEKLVRLATGRVSDKEMSHVAQGNDWVRQAALASSPFLSDPIAFELMNNLNAFVRLQLASNPMAPELVLRRLNRDPDTDVQQTAERALLRQQPRTEEAETSSGSEKSKKRKRRRGKR
ncbi:MAG: hypothetical protein AAFZ07_09495 [Actinomycetota bacterium]